MKKVLYKCLLSTPIKTKRVYIDISEDGKAVAITRNHSETSIIKMKNRLVLTVGKLRRKLDK